MKYCFIQKLIASGDNVKDSIIEFSPNLNIIYGASNTGKTYIFKVIDFMLGAESLDIRLDTGYNTFTIDIRVDENILHLTRKLGDKMFDVQSEVPGISSGIYPCDQIRNIYLSLMDIPSDIRVPYTQKGGSKAFSCRMVLDFAKLSEETVEKTNSILIPKTTMNKTYYLAHLLYMLYRFDFTDYLSEKQEYIVARRSAVKQYIASKLNQLEEQIFTLTQSLNTTRIVAEKDMVLFTKELSDIKTKIDSALSEGTKLLGEINSISDKITECEFLIYKYKSLESQLVADVKRLSFTLEGSLLFSSNMPECKCPSCGEKFINASPFMIDQDAVVAEINKISSQADDLIQTIQEVEKEKTSYETQLQNLEKQKKEYEFSVQELERQQSDLQHKINIMSNLLIAQAELDATRRLQTEFMVDMQTHEKQGAEALIFKPQEIFENSLYEGLTENIQHILERCGHPKAKTAYFDKKSLDLVVDNQKKSTNGKGFTALYNTVLFLSIRKLLNDKAQCKPFTYLLDTPLHGLDLGNLEAHVKNIRRGIYNYFIESQNQGQLIIFDNKKNMPTNNTFLANINCYEFTHEENNGRYGFLLEHRD